MAKSHLKKGDSVIVIAGNFRGSNGRILELSSRNSRARVEGVNLLKKHSRRSAANPQGGIVEVEGTIHVSNLKRAL
jgi:large subunit ribosomal protein L24